MICARIDERNWCHGNLGLLQINSCLWLQMSPTIEEQYLATTRFRFSLEPQSKLRFKRWQWSRFCMVSYSVQDAQLPFLGSLFPLPDEVVDSGEAKIVWYSLTAHG